MEEFYHLLLNGNKNRFWAGSIYFWKYSRAGVMESPCFTQVRMAIG
jgi:hypothetical protein